MIMKKNVLRYDWLLLLILCLPSLGAAAKNNGVRYYVSVGTSLAVGIQPDANGTNQLTDDGYADQLFDAIESQFRKIRLAKLGCPGETTETMITGGICTYPKKSQLAEAVKFLHAHKDKVELITIDMGVNDILSAGCIIGTDIDVPCITQVFDQVSVNLPLILTALREAAHPETPIIGMDYYNPFLGFWLTGPAGQSLAVQSASLAESFNIILAGIYAGFGIPVADVAGAFQSDDFSTMTPFPPPHGLVPINVALICQWTYMCVSPPVGPNIHANPIGYGVIAAAFVGVLPPF